MPVNVPYPGYDKEVEKVKRVRDFNAGEDAVKAAGEAYLPRLGGQNKDDYNAYLDRGYLIPAVSPTAAAICGAIMRKPPTGFYSDDIDGEGTDTIQFASGMIKELLLAGGAGYLVEYENGAVIKQYTKENVINYSDDYIVLAQKYTEQNPKDKFEQTTKTEYLELTFDDGGYIQNLWRETKQGWQILNTVTPTNRGERLQFLPFVYAAPNKLGFTTSDPLLLHLTNVNRDQYRLSTDQRHGLHWTALPTLFLFGDLRDDQGAKKQIKIGAGSANHIDDAESRAELLEFTGQGLGALKAAIDDNITTMASIGAKMLTGSDGGVKAAETARIEASSETATLSTIANTVDLAMNQLLDIIAEWAGETNEEFSINRDFIDVKLDPQALLAYLQVYQSGGMSLNSFLNLLVKGELLPADVSAEDEADRIETTGQDFEQGGFDEEA